VGLQRALAAALIVIGACAGLTQKQLVVRLDVEQPGVARTLNGLEADGWIERQSIKGRAQGLYLTDKARAVVPEAAGLAAAIDRRALEELSRTERAHLIDALGEVIATLKTA
jgi:DNA-binding MarR family transcriptional regulator